MIDRNLFRSEKDIRRTASISIAGRVESLLSGSRYVVRTMDGSLVQNVSGDKSYKPGDRVIISRIAGVQSDMFVIVSKGIHNPVVPSTFRV